MVEICRLFPLDKFVTRLPLLQANICDSLHISACIPALQVIRHLHPLDSTMTHPAAQPDRLKSAADLSFHAETRANVSVSQSEEEHYATIGANLVLVGIDTPNEIDCCEEPIMDCWHGDDCSLISTDESDILSLLDRAIAISEDHVVGTPACFDTLRSDASQSPDLLSDRVGLEIMLTSCSHDFPPDQPYQGSSAQMEEDAEADERRLDGMVHNVPQQ